MGRFRRAACVGVAAASSSDDVTTLSALGFSPRDLCHAARAARSGSGTAHSVPLWTQSEAWAAAGSRFLEAGSASCCR